MHREHSRNPDPTDLVTLGKLCFAKGLVLGRPRIRIFYVGAVSRYTLGAGSSGGITLSPSTVDTSASFTLSVDTFP